MDTLITRGGVGITKMNETRDERRHQQKDELTICGLCKKDIFVPKNFPCLHSFCEMCISDYVKNFKRQKKLKGQTPLVFCPICETPITFRSLDNPKEFAESLQTSTLTTTLLTKRPDILKECSLCPETDKKDAASWCFYCARAHCETHESYHKAVTSSKVKHQVYPIKKVRDVPDALYKSQSCRFHEKSPIGHFCMDHLSSCCTICWKRMHKVCNVVPIDQAARIIHKSRITLELDQKIDYLLVKVKDTLVERNDLLETIEKQRNITMKSVTSFRKSLDKYIDSLQANMEKDIETHYQHVKSQIEREIHDFQNKQINFEHYQKLLKSIGQFSQPIQSLSELTDVRQQCDELSESMSRSFFEMKQYKLSATFISLQQVAHVISKLGSAVTTENAQRSRSRAFSESMRSRSQSRYSSHESLNMYTSRSSKH